MERVLKFLLVEDNPGDADLIIELLSETKLKKSIIQQAGDLKSALAMLNKDTFDIILLDLGLPDSSGLTGLRKIIEINSGIPIVVVSGQDDLTMSKEAIQQGAEDYLIKGRIDDEILSRVVLYSIERNKQKRELQAVYQQLLASEQQLRESNQQLTDSVQQLQASNQQLAASEQQLRVNNHKLAASERELILAKERAEKSELSQIVQKEEIALNNERLESLVRISRLQTSSIQELLDFALEEAIKLTKSKIGYIYFYNETTRQFTLNTWSNEVMQECKVMNPQTVYDLDKTGCWGDAVRQKKPVIINNFPEFNALRKATPEGHVQLLKFLTIPVFIDGEIVAVAGVANKDNDYEENDIRHLTLLMDSVWKISERISLINDLKKAKERAEKNERELKKAQEITHIGSWHLNVATNEVSWSEELYKMYGFNPSLPVPPYTEHMNLFTPESWDLLSSSLANTRETGIPYELELKTVRKDLSNGWMWVRGEAMRNNNNEIIALWGVAQDISERKQLEQELILAKEKAEESDRLKSAFLANMSHEIRTPMNGILGFTNLILEPDLSSEEKEEFINLVQKSGQRMLNTVNDIIEIS
ncbi:MAG: GAF domain-containing protein, partial [Candidatus Kapabacteria bacterium]|nr:GAF domain-containing protein [Candidatus Kapabacteria bacterium]